VKPFLHSIYRIHLNFTKSVFKTNARANNTMVKNRKWTFFCQETLTKTRSHGYFDSQETFTKTFFCDDCHIMNRWSLQHEKIRINVCSVVGSFPCLGFYSTNQENQGYNDF